VVDLNIYEIEIFGDDAGYWEGDLGGGNIKEH